MTNLCPYKIVLRQLDIKEKYKKNISDSKKRESNFADTDDVLDSSQLYVGNYLLLSNGGEAKRYNEAWHTIDVNKWKLSMEDKMKSLISNDS